MNIYKYKENLSKILDINYENDEEFKEFTLILNKNIGEKICEISSSEEACQQIENLNLDNCKKFCKSYEPLYNKIKEVKINFIEKL